VGSPISTETASSLERAIEEAISLQPYVSEVRVRIDKGMLSSNVFGYGELQGRMIHAEVTIAYENAIVRAVLDYDPSTDYPLMRLLD